MSEPSSLFVIMLEDDADRVARFTRVLQNSAPALGLRCWRTASAFIDNYRALSGVPELIALDHDLFRDDPNDPDPGDGRDVATFLTTKLPRCPILIHSTNSIAADSMLFMLRDAGWNVERISPLGSDWIEGYWYPVAMQMIAGQMPFDRGA